MLTMKRSTLSHFSDIEGLGKQFAANRNQLQVPRSRSFTAIDAVLSGGRLALAWEALKKRVRHYAVRLQFSSERKLKSPAAAAGDAASATAAASSSGPAAASVKCSTMRARRLGCLMAKTVSVAMTEGVCPTRFCFVYCCLALEASLSLSLSIH